MEKLQNRDVGAKEAVAFFLIREAMRMHRLAAEASEVGLVSVVDDLSEAAAVAEDLVALLTGRRPE